MGSGQWAMGSGGGDPRRRAAGDASSDVWQTRATALRLVYADFALLHSMVIEEIGHPLPPDMGEFVRDWLDTAARAVERNVSGLP